LKRGRSEALRKPHLESAARRPAIKSDEDKNLTGLALFCQRGEKNKAAVRRYKFSKRRFKGNSFRKEGRSEVKKARRHALWERILKKREGTQREVEKDLETGFLNPNGAPGKNESIETRGL